MENENGAVITLIILVVFAFLLLVAKFTEFIVRFNQETKYIVMEINRASDHNEYRYWRRELRCHYLCLIPFVNERNVSGVYSFFFHQPKRIEKETRKDGVFHILAPSLAALCLCAVCLCGASWAWFTASSGVGAAKVQAATYAVKIERETDTDVWQEYAAPIRLDGGKTYKLRITPNGTATDGYCTVKIGDKTYQTIQILKGSSLEFSVTVKANEDATLSITPHWGTGPDTDTKKISSRAEIDENGTVQVMSSLSQTRANGSGDAPSASASTGENNVSTNEEGNSVSTNEEGNSVSTNVEGNSVSTNVEGNSVSTNVEGNSVSTNVEGNSAQGSTGSAAQEAGARE